MNKHERLPPDDEDGAEDADVVVKISEAKSRLSELIARAEAGERVVITRGPDPVIELVPLARPISPIGAFAALGIPVDIEKLEQQLREPFWTEEELDEMLAGIEAPFK